MADDNINDSSNDVQHQQAATTEEEEELVRMRGGANRLSACLDSLMRRIEQLEEQRLANGGTLGNGGASILGDYAGGGGIGIFGSGAQSPTSGTLTGRAATAAVRLLASF